MNSGKNFDSKIIAFTDAGGGAAAVKAAEDVAGWLSSKGIPSLILLKESGGTTTIKRSSSLRSILDHLDSVALTAYLSRRPLFNSGALVCDEALTFADLKQLARAYRIFIICGPEALVRKMAGPIHAMPAMIVLAELSRDSIRTTGELIERLFEKETLIYPQAFILSSSDTSTAAKLSDKWRISFCGSLSSPEHIAEFVVDRAVELKCVGGEGFGSADLKKIDACAENVLESIRSDPKFIGMEPEAGCAETKGVLQNKIAAEAKRVIESSLPAGLSEREKCDVIKKVIDEAAGFGAIERIMADPDVTEIMINGKGDVYEERAGRISKLSASYANRAKLMSMIERMLARAGRRVDESSPMVDARLPDGSRLNVVIPPLAVDGPAVTIRRFMKRMTGVDDAVSAGLLTNEMARFLADSVRERASVVISGGTGSGKTTLLNILSSSIDPRERVITVEDAAELCLTLPHVVRLESRPASLDGTNAVTIRDLVKNALRMRPDRIIVGECRGAEALDMLQAMNTGHEGSLTTVHANTPRDALLRIETMVLMAGVELPISAIREQMVRAINFVVQVARMKGGERKVVEISEVTGLEGQTPSMQTIAKFSHEKGALVATGFLSRFVERCRTRGAL